MSIPIKSPDQKNKERLAQNPREAIDTDPVTWRNYSKTTPRDFGMHSKKIRKQRR